MSKLPFIALISVVIFSCTSELEQEPKDIMTKSSVFNTESGIQLYLNSFYTQVPSGATYFPLVRDDVGGVDVMADFMAERDIPNFLKPGAFGPQQSSGWTWTYLRNVNYFLENIQLSSVSEDAKRNYIGIARFFRAWFYFDKVKRFGDVPWIGSALDVSDEALFNGRDSRTLVMDSILADLNYACENIQMTNDPSKTVITKYVAYALKSRICLFEGTFRKYQTTYNLQSTSEAWLRHAADAAKVVMDEAGFSLDQGDKAYRNLFVSTSPTPEVILATLSSKSLSVLHAANWYMFSPSYGPRGCPTRSFINTYLTIDGTPFTDKVGYSTMTFQEETKGRDLRLEQTIKTKGYGRINSGELQLSAPHFAYTYTGYQFIKWAFDDVTYDDGMHNDNVIIVIRLAEVLLNYAEAQAELGVLTDGDWNETIGALRRRAGITGGTQTKPVNIDTYLQQNYFPEISDPSILEIRRERGIELVLEDFRFNDLVRWKKGDLLENEWNGMYVSETDKYLDLNEDGSPDVYFYLNNPPEQIAGVTYINVSPVLSGGMVNPMQLANGDHGEILWMSNVQKEWDDKYYLYPIPEADLLINPALGQNPGWQ